MSLFECVQLSPLALSGSPPSARTTKMECRRLPPFFVHHRRWREQIHNIIRRQQSSVFVAQKILLACCSDSITNHWTSITYFVWMVRVFLLFQGRNLRKILALAIQRNVMTKMTKVCFKKHKNIKLMYCDYFFVVNFWSVAMYSRYIDIYYLGMFLLQCIS